MKPPVVIIPSRNAANLVACLTALRTHWPDCPVIVVDDGVDWAKVHNVTGTWLTTDVLGPGPARIIPGVSPFVFARNVNIGIRAAGDSDVVILNDDALLESPGGFQRLQRCANNWPEIGIIGATTNVTGQPLQYRQPLPAGSNMPSEGLRVVPHIAFVCVLIPRRTIDAVGMLDEDFCEDYGVEDRAYCEVVTRAGLKVAVHDGCFVDHSKLTSTFRGDPHAAKSFAKNYAILMRKFNGKLVT